VVQRTPALSFRYVRSTDGPVTDLPVDAALAAVMVRT
jgi:hypothetical protein